MKAIVMLCVVLTTAHTNLYSQSNSGQSYKVAVFIYQGVELLDFAGPLEVFSNATGFEVFTVAPTEEPVLTMNKNIRLVPNYTLRNCPKPDILVIPGANMAGLMPVYNDSTIIKWISTMSKSIQYTMSVCTGAALLSKGGVLDGHTVTTHWGAVENLRMLTPKATVVANKRFVEDGNLVTTAGVSAGLDGALHLISRIRGKEEALRIIRLIEYDKWDPEQGLIK